MKPWRPALRMARRDLRRHKLRAVLTFLMVAIPVFVATVAAQAEHAQSWDLEVEAQVTYGDADGIATVSEFSSIKRSRWVLGYDPRPSAGATTRDPVAVDLAALLPAGSEIARAPFTAPVALSTGGWVGMALIDPSSKLTDAFVSLLSGRLPAAPDEVAMAERTAEVLGLLNEDGRPKAGATVDFVDGQRLRLVGTFPEDSSIGEAGEAVLIAPFGSVVPLRQADTEFQDLGAEYLVTLPDDSRTTARQLVRDLAAAGVVFEPRDARVHPEAWGMEDYSGLVDVDLTPAIVGALVVLVGLIEVVILVGAAFSVSARRQLRDLGLLAANGGAGTDVRRILLAQGVVVGVLASLAATAAGVGAYAFAATRVADTFGWHPVRDDLDWISPVVIAVLGSLTSVAAALAPAWRVGRLAPAQALSGRFPVTLKEARMHRGAFLLVGVGLAVLTLGGWSLARAHRSVRGQQYEGAAAFVAGLGLVLLIAGAIWCTPYLVRRVAASGRTLPLSGRYAFRDAGRHRFRTAAAVTALAITAAGAVLAGFGFKSAARASYDVPPQTIVIDGLEGDASQRGAALQTVRRVLRPETVVTAGQLGPVDRPRRTSMVRGAGPLLVTDEDSLRSMVRVDDQALAVFRRGGVLTTHARVVRDGHVVASVDGGRRPRPTWSLPAAAVPKGDLGDVGHAPADAFVSEDTAAALGFQRTYNYVVARTAEPITAEQVDELRLHGIYGWTQDSERALASRLQYSGLGVAGLLTAIVVGIAVALAAAESRDDVSTLAAVGAGPWRRRGLGAMHGLFIGLVASMLGVAIGVPAGMALTQVDGLPGIDMAWLPTFGTVGVVLLLSWVIGGVVTPSRFRLSRRVA